MEITTGGKTWKYLEGQPPAYLSNQARKAWEVGFQARAYDIAYDKRTGNPYLRRHMYAAWEAGYRAAKEQH